MEVTPHLIARRLLSLATQAQQHARQLAAEGEATGALRFLASARRSLEVAGRVIPDPVLVEVDEDADGDEGEGE